MPTMSELNDNTNNNRTVSESNSATQTTTQSQFDESADSIELDSNPAVPDDPVAAADGAKPTELLDPVEQTADASPAPQKRDSHRSIPAAKPLEPIKANETRLAPPLPSMKRADSRRSIPAAASPLDALKPGEKRDSRRSIPAAKSFESLKTTAPSQSHLSNRAIPAVAPAQPATSDTSHPDTEDSYCIGLRGYAKEPAHKTTGISESDTEDSYCIGLRGSAPKTAPKADDKPARGTEPDTEDSYCIGLRGSAKTPVAKPAPSSGNAPSEDKKSPATTRSNSTDANAIDSDQSSASSKGANASDDNKRPAFQTTDDLLSAILDAKPNNDKRQTDDHSSDELFSAILDANKNSDKKPIDDKNAQAAADATNEKASNDIKGEKPSDKSPIENAENSANPNSSDAKDIEKDEKIDAKNLADKKGVKLDAAPSIDKKDIEKNVKIAPQNQDDKKGVKLDAAPSIDKKEIEKNEKIDAKNQVDKKDEKIDAQSQVDKKGEKSIDVKGDKEKDKDKTDEKVDENSPEISDVVCAIADLPTQMINAFCEDEPENNIHDSSSDSDNIQLLNETEEFGTIDPPNMPSIPTVPPSEFERTIVFERSENRWDDADSNTLPKPGDTVGNYRIIDMLGKGGFGAVYRAKNLTLGREEALKLILPSAKSECDDIDKRFEREVAIVSRLEHPNIVRLYSSGLLPHNVLWMTMELIRGTRLDKRIDKGALSFARAKSIMKQILSGLMEAHRLQIVHRDLKPANIMLANKEGYDDQVSILDFGLSKALGADADAATQDLTLADSRRVYGTPQYMAPEQLNRGHLGPWTDVYAAGLIFYELLTGHPAVVGDSLFEIAYKQSYENLQLPSNMFGTAIEAVIMRACNKNPAQRFAHAGEFLHALERIKTPDDPPSVLANYRSEPTINLTDNGEKTRISMPAVQQTSAQRPATPTKSQAHFYINIVAYPLAILAILIILCALFGIIHFSF